MVIILMYHAILKDAGRALLPAEDPYYTLTRDAFAEQMEYLAGVTRLEGYEVSSLSEVTSSQDCKVSNSRIVLTFDDGLKSHYDLVGPVLEKYRFTGHFFITAGNIGKTGYMNCGDIINLRKAGHIIGSHGMSHRILTTLDREAVTKELKDSRLAISEIIGEPVDCFSVPGGFYDSYIKEIAEDAGYKAVLTSGMGINGNGLSLYHLKRIAVKKNMTMNKFKSIIEKRKIPPADKVEYFSKRTLQRILGDERYHKFRKMVLHC